VREIAAVGDRLDVGDTLARIDTEQATLAAVEQGARLQRLGIEFELAQRQLQRFSQLAESAHVSRLQLDEAESRLQALAAERGEAEAALAQIQLQLDRAHLRAPIAGLVVERFAEPGEWLGAGQTLLRLVDTNALEVRARAPLEWASGLAPGSLVQLRGQRGDRPVGISALVPVGDEVSRQLELRVALEGGGLAVGSAVQLGVPTAAPRPALSVPRDALLVRREGRFVMRVTEDDRAERVEVEPGESADAWIAVTGALAAGDRVIVRGAERLIDGQRVQVSDAPMTALAVGGGTPP
jgi:RND family efflux transporter MFP subunit